MKPNPRHRAAIAVTILRAMVEAGWSKKHFTTLSTHWAGCHRSHPDCAFIAGFLAGVAWQEPEKKK